MPGLLIAGISLYTAWKQAQNRKLAAAEAAPAVSPTPTLPPPGWYVDPWQVAFARWWNGVEWTHHTYDPPVSS